MPSAFYKGEADQIVFELLPLSIIMSNPQISFKWLSYITGIFGLLSINSAVVTMLIYRYDPEIPNTDNLPFLVPSALVGIAMLIGRLGGSIIQPIIGHISDRFWSRWGRRRPFLAMAIVPMVVSFSLLLTPPLNNSRLENIVYLTVLLCSLSLATAVYQVSYLAWLPSLSQTPEQRVTLSSLMAISGMLGGAIGGIGSPLLVDRYGFSGMAMILGAISSVALAMPLMIQEETLAPSIIMSPTLKKSLHSALQNRSFKSYIAGFSSAGIAISIVSACPAFLAVALLGKDVSFGAVVNGIILGSGIIGFAVVIPLAKRWGKRRAFQWAMIWLGCGLLIVGILPLLVGQALMPWLLLLLLSNLGSSSFFILPNAMLPDVIDRDERNFGVRREAIFFGTRGLLQNMSQGMGVFLAGILLMLGKTPAQPWGVQLAFPVAGLFAIAAAWAFVFYPIEE